MNSHKYLFFFSSNYENKKIELNRAIINNIQVQKLGVHILFFHADYGTEKSCS